MQVFRTVRFRRFMEAQNLPIAAICRAAWEVDAGLIHANLGGGVYKQRVARAGQGKSGSFRTVVFYKLQGRAFFILGFAKNERESLRPPELKALKELAKEMLGYGEEEISRVVANGTLEAILCPETHPERGA